MARLGPGPLRFGAVPKRLRLYRTDQPFRKIRSAEYVMPGEDPAAAGYKPHAVEVMGDGQQIVCFGTHPGTGKPYAWPVTSPLDVRAADLPTITADQAAAVVVEAEQILVEFGAVLYRPETEKKKAPRAGRTARGPASTGRGQIWSSLYGSETTDIGRLARALDAIPNNDLDYDAWVRIGLALKSACGAGDDAEGERLWMEWSARSRKHDPDYSLKKWRGEFTNVRSIGAGTIFYLARMHGWEEQGPPDNDFPPRDPPPNGGDERETWEDEVAPPPVPGASLPPYWPGPDKPPDEALAEQAGAITGWLLNSTMLVAARREVERRRAEAFEAEGLVQDELDFNPPSPEVSKRKAAITRRIKAEVARSYGWARIAKNGLRRLISGSQGTGKSRSGARDIADLRDHQLVIRWLVPTLEKAEEQAAEYRRLASRESLPVTVIRGRGAADPLSPGDTMCPRHKVVNRAAAVGVNVERAICASCPLARSCGFRRQQANMKAGGLFIMAHPYLWFPCPAPKPDLIIVDESVINGAGDVAEFGPSRITEDAKWKGGDLDAAMRNRVTATAVLRAVTEHPGRELEFLRSATTLEVLREAIAHLATIADDAPAVDGRMEDPEIEQVLDAFEATETRLVLLLFRQIAREWATDRGRLNTVTFDPNAEVSVGGKSERQPRISVYYLKRLRPGASTPILLLDGTGNVDLNRRIFGPRVEEVRVAVERDAYIVQVGGKLFSRQSITGCDRKGQPISTQKLREAEILRAQIVAYTETLTGDVFLGGTKQAVEALLDELPPHVLTAHFGALRGINGYEHCGTGTNLGREQPSAPAIEAKTRPFTASDPEPLIPFGEYVSQIRRRRMRDGSVSIEEVLVHPDPRCQAMLEQVREAEIVQNLDRTRPVFNHRKLNILTSIVADVTVDRVMSWADLRHGGTRYERAWKEKGILPTGAKALATAFPNLWRSTRAAERCLEREKPPTSQIIYTIGAVGGFSALRYRLQGQRGRPSVAFVDDTRHPDPKISLEALFGPLDLFEVAEVYEASPAAPPPPEPDIAPPPEEPPAPKDGPAEYAAWTTTPETTPEEAADEGGDDGNVVRGPWPAPARPAAPDRATGGVAG